MIQGGHSTINNFNLQEAVDLGIINLQDVRERMDMIKRSELLEKHPYKIWKGKDGKWHTYLPNKEKGRVAKKRNTQKDIEDVVIGYWKSEMENPSIDDVFTEWNNRRLELQKISNATHLRNQQIFNRHYSVLGKRKIKSLEPEEFCEFLERQIPEQQLNSKAFSNLKTITRGFLRRARKRKLINFSVDDVFGDLDTSETDFKRIIKEDYQEVFSEDEMPVILEYLEANPDIMNLGILLMFVTGARIGEVVALKHSDFDGNTFKIRRTETRYRNEAGKYVYEVKEFPKSKAGVRTAIIPDDYSRLSQRLKMQNPFSEYIFMKNENRITTPAMRMRLRRICHKIAIYPKSPHKIRKTYGSILLDNHIDNRLIIGQMGHTDINCTEEHYHRSRKNIERKKEILSNIPEFCAK